MFTESLDLKVHVCCVYDVRKNEKAWDPSIFCKPFQRLSNSICDYRGDAKNQSHYQMKFNQVRWDLKVERNKARKLW